MDILAGIVQEGQTTAKTYAGVYVGGSDATGRYAINNEPEDEGVAVSGPDDEGPYTRTGTGEAQTVMELSLASDLVF